MKLSELKTGSVAIIVKVHGHGAFRKRLLEMGFVKGHVITVLLHAPLKDPIKYSILGYEISLRASEAALIDVVPITTEEGAVIGEETVRAEVAADEESAREIFDHHRHLINVALIGNPNCGKTSLFNIASGAKEHVGNYSGVTVDAKTGHFMYAGYRFNIIDLPGTYSLSCYSPEELYVRQYLRTDTPDVILNVVDSSNLQRNLYLTTELIDMDISMVIALNMYDELRASDAKLDYENLSKMIGVPMIPVVSKTGEGLQKLFDTVIAVYEGQNDVVRHIHVNLGTDLEGAIRQLVDMIKATPNTSKHFSPRYMAIKLLEGDHEMEEEIPQSQTSARPSVTVENKSRCSNRLCFFHKSCCGSSSQIFSPPSWKENLRKGSNNPIILLRDKLRGHIENINGEEISSIVAAEKYGFVAGALAETYSPGVKKGNHLTHILDSLATNKIIGFPIFFAIMFFIFWATFDIGQYPMDWIDNTVAWLSDALQRVMPEGIVKDMVVDGILGGVGGVIVFLPNILILYFCISFMEDSGYMARAAFIMDKVMHRIGLHGKSFIPLIMGFGCNVPAILASRSIESRSSRIITILINPFMSCSARLPIYVLLAATFFPTHAAAVFCSLYFAGILVAIITARLLRKFLFHKDETPFVMELPPYRMPTMKASLSHTWAKGKEYIKKMGGIILFASIIVWALNYFPMNRAERDLAQLTEQGITDDSQIDLKHDSYLEIAGKFINPVMEPLGFKWRASVAAAAGIPAKEIVVSTLGVLYTNDEASSETRIGERLQAPNPITGKPDFTPAAALSFLTFILLYCPCLATLTAIARETNSWKYAVFSIVYNTAVAWILAFAVYRIALLF